MMKLNIINSQSLPWNRDQVRGRYLNRVACCLILFAAEGRVYAQDLVLPEGYPQYEISSTKEVSPGYTFLSLNSGTEDTWLLVLDNYGTPVFYRHHPEMYSYFQLQPSGYLSLSVRLESGRTTAILDSCYKLLDLIPIRNGYEIDRHDFLHTSEGEYMLLGRNPDTMDLSGIVEGGYENTRVEGAVIQIQNRDKEVVFEWNAMDHFDIMETWSPLAARTVDNVHPNSIETDLDGNLLLISRSMNEITKINRTSGDIIWRLGGKKNQFTFTNSYDEFFMPHSIGVLENGNLVFFDNGNLHIPPYSRAMEYKLDTENMRVTRVWDYNAERQYFSRIKGSAQRLENGNTIICYGGRDNPAVLEVTESGEVAMKLRYMEELKYTVGDASPVAHKYPWKTSLISTDRDSINFGEWEGNSPTLHNLKIRNNSGGDLELSNYHVHSKVFYFEKGIFPLTLSAGEERSLELFYSPADIDGDKVTDILTLNSDITSDTLIQRIAIQVHLRGTKKLTSFKEKTSDSFHVFPNPVHDVLHIESNQPYRAVVSIYTLNGSLLRREGLTENRTTIDMKKLEAGLYIIEITDAASGRIHREKIVMD